MSSLKSSIEKLSAQGEVERDPEARKTFLEFRDQLTQGRIRAAEKLDGPGKDGRWIYPKDVAKRILALREAIAQVKSPQNKMLLNSFVSGVTFQRNASNLQSGAATGR